MKRNLLTLIVSSIWVISIQSQVIFHEDFEAGTFPAGWSQQTNASDGGWLIGDAGSLSSFSWNILSNGSQNIAATNDDGCNCDKGADYLILPVLDLTGHSGVALSVDLFFWRGTYDVFTEDGTIEASTDGMNWIVIDSLFGHHEWITHKVDLSQFAGEDSLYIAFHYNDNGGWVYGMAIDNVTIEVPLTLDASLKELHYHPFGEENTDVKISGEIYNNGITPVTSVEISYSINDENLQTAILDGLDIQPFTSLEFTHPVIWNPDIPGISDVEVSIVKVNNTIDEDSTNNTLSFQTEIFPSVTIPNRVDEFLLAEPVFTTIATSAGGLDKPNDLDFFPILGKNELWVVNERTANSGGSTLTVYDAGTPDQTFLDRTDGNAWHFMSLPTGIAFSDNFNFGTSPGIKDANHSNGTFTGPTLWSSDPEIYAQPSGGNGSHLDMLHGSPFSMGIESEGDNVFWVFDGWNQSVFRYDFMDDHGPGNDDHSDGVVSRYTEIQVKRDDVVPSHLVLDKSTGWMYVVDNGNDRVFRLDINSGEVTNELPLINETLAGHYEMGNVTWEVIIDQGLNRPSGIELIEDRLLVSDYATGEIIIYDTENNFSELGRVSTGLTGITGLAIGPDGAIWYTNRLENTLTKMEPGDVTGTKDEDVAKKISVNPNPTSGILSIDLSGLSLGKDVFLELSDIAGRHIKTYKNLQPHHPLNLMGWPEGIYMLTIYSNDFHVTKKIILKK